MTSINFNVERTLWKRDSSHIDGYVDRIVYMLKVEGGAAPAAYMAADQVFRPYLQWLYAARQHNTDATLVRNSTVHLINVIILELITKMNGEADGITLSSREWLDDILSDVLNEVLIDLQRLDDMKKRPSQPQ
jgi:hypothetical protein